MVTRGSHHGDVIPALVRTITIMGNLSSHSARIRTFKLGSSSRTSGITLVCAVWRRRRRRSALTVHHSPRAPLVGLLTWHGSLSGLSPWSHRYTTRKFGYLSAYAHDIAYHHERGRPDAFLHRQACHIFQR
jgi:hypothetical protein